MKRCDMAPSHDAAPSWVRRYYPLPDPLATFEQAERWQHLDVPDRSEDGLRAELNRITLRLLYDPRPAPWLLERRAVLRREIASRGVGPEQPGSSPSPQRPAEAPRPTLPEPADRPRPSWHPLSGDTRS
jgi:hypothetical protein